MKHFFLSITLLTFLITPFSIYAMAEEDELKSRTPRPSISIRSLDISFDLSELGFSLSGICAREHRKEFIGLQKVTLSMSLPGERWASTPIDIQTGKGHIALDTPIDTTLAQSSYRIHVPMSLESGEKEVHLKETEYKPNGWFKFHASIEYEGRSDSQRTLENLHYTHTGHGYLFYPSSLRGQISLLRAPFVDEVTTDSLAIHFITLNSLCYFPYVTMSSL